MQSAPNQNPTFRELLFNKLMLVVIPIVLLLAYELISSRDSAHQNAANESATISSVVAGKLTFILDETVADLSVISSQIPIRVLDKPASGQNQKAIEEMLRNQHHGFQYISAIRVFSAAGDLLYTSNQEDPRSFNTADRTHFKVHQEWLTHDIWYSEVLVDRTSNKPAIFISKAIRGANQKFHGIVLAAIELETLFRIFREVPLGPNGSIALRRSDNSALIARYPESKEAPNAILKKSIAKEKIDQGSHTGTFRIASPIDGVPRTYSHQKIAGYPFYLVTGLAETDYLVAWRRQSTTTIFIAALLILGVAYVLSKQASYQIQKIRDDKQLLIFSLAVEQSPNSIVITDPNGKIIYVNAAFEQITGYSKEEAIGQNPRFLQSGETKPSVYRSMWASLTSGKTWDGEIINQRKNGERFHEHLRVAPVTQADGEITGYIAMIEDISERKSLELQLAQERENLETEVAKRTSELRSQEMRTSGILRTMLDGLIHIDNKGIIVTINDSALNIFGYEEQSDLIGKNITELMPSNYRAGHNAHFFRYDPANSSKVIGGRIEVEGLKKDGTIFPLELAIKALVDDKGLSFIGAVRDLTAQKMVEAEKEQARAEAEQLAQIKSDFLANMSHEIRTPLNAIVGLNELCLMSDLNNRQRSYLEKIKTASDSLLHLINDILDFSKIEAGKLHIEQTPFVLETVFDQLSSVVAHQAEKQGVELTFDIDDTAKVFLGDPLRLGQVLINLSSNAIKFSHAGNVIVKASLNPTDSSEAELLFSVTDQGIGMTASQLESVFDPFTQADASTTRKYGGTGLGLAICSRLVENMGGKIWASSQVGQGSVFSFTVKVGVFGVDRRMGIAEFAKKLSSNAHRPVLIIDDNAISLKSMGTLVGQLGLQCHKAKHANEALAYVQGDTLPDYLACLIDWKMPDIDGIACIHQLRAIYVAAGKTPPPMILATTYSHSRELESITDSIDGLLSKPVSARHLYVELANAAGIAPSQPAEEKERRKSSGKDWSSLHLLDVLVAEDVDVNREVIRELLASVGLHKVRIVNNGLEAVQAVEQRTPDLVLMDCQMPVLDGFEATQKIRLLPGAHHLPIIALTANATLADKERCFEAGMNGHVAKPIRMEMLFEQISRCLPELRLKQEKSPPSIEPTKKSQDTANFPGIDLATAMTNVGGSLPFLLKVLKKFRDNQGAHFEQEFQQAILAEDWESLYRQAHSLKGVSKTLGATRLGEIAVALQDAAEKRDMDTIKSQIHSVRYHMNEIVSGLANLDTLMKDSK